MSIIATIVVAVLICAGLKCVMDGLEKWALRKWGNPR